MNVYPITFRKPDGSTFAATLVTEVSLQDQFWNLAPLPNGTEYSGTQPGPSWAALPNLLNQNASVSVNILTTYVTPTVGVTLALAPGVTLPAGWAFNTGTNLLTYNGSSVSGPVTVSFIATLTSTGATSPSNTFTVSGIGSTSSDVTAPTVPVGVAASAITTTTATLSGFPSSDPAPSGTTWSGLQQYNVTIPGAPGSPFTVSSAAGNQPVLTKADIGPQTSTITQTGADIAFVTTAVDAPYPTNSALAAAYQQLTGTSWVLSCKVSSFASSNAFSNLRMEARPTLVGNGAYVAVLTAPFSQGQGISSEYRASAGGSVAGLQSVPNTAGPVWLFIVRSGDSYSFYYSLDGENLVSLGTQTQAMGSTLYVLVGANSSDGTAVSGTVQQFNIQTLSNWSLNLTGLAANTTYPGTITAQDTAGNVSAAASFSFTTASGSGGGSVVFPQVASYNISARAGAGSYNNPAQIAYMQHMNTCVTGCFDGWESFNVTYDGTHNGSMHAFTQSVQNGSKQPGGTVMLADYDTVVLNPNIAATNQVAAKMDLLSTYPGGSHVLNGANHIGNICTVGTQPTFGGRNANTYNADYAFDQLANGGALGLAGNAVSANPTLNGWYLDDTNPDIRWSGDWLRNGTTQASENTGTSAASLALKSAYGTMMARLKANKPGALVFGNLAGLYLANVNLTNYPQFDGGNGEHAMGTSNSADSFSDWFAMVAILAKQKAALKPGGILLVGHDNVLNDGSDFYRTAPGQAGRYGIATAMMVEGQWAPNPAGAQPNMTRSNALGDYQADHFGSWLWRDELAVNPTTLVAYAFGDASIATGCGWGGTPLAADAGVMTTLWQGTVVRKRFQMSGGRQLHVMINTSKTTAQTVNYSQRMMAFTGSQNSTVNSGNNNITSESIPAADARFRITYP